MNIIKLPVSRTKRDFNSLLKRLEKGSLDMVQITKKGNVSAWLVRKDGDYQPPRELFDNINEDIDQ